MGPRFANDVGEEPAPQYRQSGNYVIQEVERNHPQREAPAAVLPEQAVQRPVGPEQWEEQ